MTIHYTCNICDPPVPFPGKRGYNTHMGRFHKNVAFETFKIRYEKKPCHFCNIKEELEKKWTTSTYPDSGGVERACCLVCKRQIRRIRSENYMI